MHAVVVNGEAVAFVGESTFGKSTLARVTFVQAGCASTDDCRDLLVKGPHLGEPGQVNQVIPQAARGSGFPARTAAHLQTESLIPLEDHRVRRSAA